MGSTCLPAIDDYWKKVPPSQLQTHCIANLERCFQDIRRFIYFRDNTTIPPPGTAGRNRLAKVRPLLTHITQKCKELYNPHQDVSVDEAMIKFQGRSFIKQYVPIKANKTGHQGVSVG